MHETSGGPTLETPIVDAPTWPRWLTEANVRGVDGRSGLRFSDESHPIQAAIAGHGVGLLSLMLVADEVATPTLVVPFGPEIESVTCYLVQSAQRPLSEAAAAVRDWLRSECVALTAGARVMSLPHGRSAPCAIAAEHCENRSRSVEFRN